MAKKRKKRSYDNRFTTIKYNAICADFKRLSAIKEHNVSKYSFDWILAHLSETKYYLLPDTLERIIKGEPDGGY